ncbi:MAG TPA: GNAT family protein [Geobacteraceae bacterium]|nr:GNAT family protein [Geobacteraceae bacterium]
MAQEYPKEVRVKDGSTVVLRLFEKDDADALFAFFARLPETSRLYLRHNVTDRAVIERWATELNYEKVYPVLAWKGKEVLANASLHKTFSGWMKHVGYIRIVTAPEYQRKGLASILANELFLHALKSGLEKIVAEMMDTQQGVKKVFEQLGFIQEAVLRGHVRDQRGIRHDLIIMTKDLEEFWADVENHEYFTYPAREMDG